jgi:hypothetical protein
MKGSEKQTPALMGGLLLRGKQDALQSQKLNYGAHPLAQRGENEKVEIYPNRRYLLANCFISTNAEGRPISVSCSFSDMPI